MLGLIAEALFAHAALREPHALAVDPLDRAPLPTISGMLMRGLDELRSHFTPSSTIAVVGSSGDLIASDDGSLIDSHDLIIRINAPVIEGYEESVGRRLNIRFATADGLADAKERQVVEDETQLLTTTYEGSPAPESNGTRAFLVSNAWTTDIRRSALDDRGWPSTGFQAVAFAIAMTREVGAPPPAVFGFGACEACNKYYDCDGSNTTDLTRGTWIDPANRYTVGNESMGTDGYHPFESEHLRLALWAKAGIIALKNESSSSEACTAGVALKDGRRWRLALSART